jgi:hypothetical protein
MTEKQTFSFGLITIAPQGGELEAIDFSRILQNKRLIFRNTRPNSLLLAGVAGLFSKNPCHFE